MHTWKQKYDQSGRTALLAENIDVEWESRAAFWLNLKFRYTDHARANHPR
jgi:hypothetical protein